MKGKELLSEKIETIGTRDTVRDAAEKMKRLGTGAVPLFDDGMPVGIITGGDITTRVVAEGKDPDQTPAIDVLTPGVISCGVDDDAKEALRLMGDKKVHRLLVLDERRRPVGIVSVGDLAARL